MKLTLRVSITQSVVTHITQPNSAFATAVNKHVTLLRMKLGRSNNFSQLFHVGWFNVNNIFEEIKSRKKEMTWNQFLWDTKSGKEEHKYDEHKNNL